jgi:hypothetical protein
LIEAGCQYRGEGGKHVSVRSPSSPCGRGTTPSFYRPRGGDLQSCRSVLTMCGGMVYSATEWTAVLANLASGGALLRVLCPSRGSFEGSGVGASRLTVMHASARGLGLRRAGGRTAASVAMSCRLGLPQRRGWWRSGGMATQGPWQWRRHTSLVRRHGVVPCGCETGVRTLFEGSAVLFRGCGVWVVREWVA